MEAVLIEEVEDGDELKVAAGVQDEAEGVNQDPASFRKTSILPYRCTLMVCEISQSGIDNSFSLSSAAPTVPFPPGPSASGRRGQTPQRGRGRGGPGPSRGQFSNPNAGTSSSYRGRGRGRGRGREFDSPGGRRRYSEGIGASPRGRGGPIRPKTTLSELLLQERPLLRPVKFVPSVHTRVLFQDEEDLLQPLVEEVGELITLQTLLFTFIFFIFNV